MARKCAIPDEERAARARLAQAKWRARNKEALRQKARALYAAQRRALLAAGYQPNPVGRPRIHKGPPDDVECLAAFLKPSPPGPRGLGSEQ